MFEGPQKMGAYSFVSEWEKKCQKMIEWVDKYSLMLRFFSCASFGTQENTA